MSYRPSFSSDATTVVQLTIHSADNNSTTTAPHSSERPPTSASPSDWEDERFITHLDAAKSELQWSIDHPLPEANEHNLTPTEIGIKVLDDVKASVGTADYRALIDHKWGPYRDHYQRDWPTRRKWVDIRQQTLDDPMLVLGSVRFVLDHYLSESCGQPNIYSVDDQPYEPRHGYDLVFDYLTHQAVHRPEYFDDLTKDWDETLKRYEKAREPRSEAKPTKKGKWRNRLGFGSGSSK